MENSLEKAVSNREEIKPAKNKSELSLVAFTLLSQIAAGMAMLSFFSRPLSISLLIAIGWLISAGGLVSFLHLGTKKNAWRAVMHLQKSWFSREILMLGLFGGSWLVSLARPGMGKLPFALCGIGLVYSMAQVYRLRSVPAWDTNRTLLAFVISTILLGGLGLEVVDVCVAVPEVGEPHTALVVAIGLIVALLLALAERNHAYKKAGRLRLGLIGLGLIGVLGIYFTPDPVGRWIAIPVFLIILAEEAIGRWLFYEQPRQRLL